jgi:transcriptional regulator with XRE-family HTH domain
MSRPARTLPRDLATRWPDLPGADPFGEVARRFAENLRLAIGDRSLRAVAEDAGLNHTTILAILDGRTWPDLQTLAKLERGTGVDLWPGRLGR